jgi:hypothetical protein
MVGVDTALHAPIELWGLTLLGPGSALCGVEIRPSRAGRDADRTEAHKTIVQKEGKERRERCAGTTARMVSDSTRSDAVVGQSPMLPLTIERKNAPISSLGLRGLAPLYQISVMNGSAPSSSGYR